MPDPLQFHFPLLDFPEDFNFSPTLLSGKGKPIHWDAHRKKHLQLTPEEWVRQHWVNWLLEGGGWGKNDIIIEVEFSLFDTKKRADLVLKNQNRNLVLIECKAPSISLDPEVFYQCARYNEVWKCPFLVLSNGKHHIMAKKMESEYGFLPFNFDLLKKDNLLPNS